MATPPRTGDRRVQRTRQMLKQAFIEVVREKGFAQISVQDIATRANVNRGTFYAHFTDKYALIDAIIRDQIQDLIGKFPPADQWDREQVYLLFETILDYFETMNQHCRPLNLVAPVAEQAAHEELTGLLLTWLKSKKRPGVSPRVPLETIAQTMSWTILGAAIRRDPEAPSLSSAQMASDILSVLIEGIGRTGGIEKL